MTGAATLAGASALSLSFATLFAGRIDTALRICVLQALAAALAAGAVGWVRHAPLLYFVALLAFVLNGLVLPLALRRMIGHAILPPTVRLRCGFLGSSADGVCTGGGLCRGSDAADGRARSRDRWPWGSLSYSWACCSWRCVRILCCRGWLCCRRRTAWSSTACAIPGLPPSILLLAAVPLVPSLVVTSAWLHDRNRLDLAPP